MHVKQAALTATAALTLATGCGQPAVSIDNGSNSGQKPGGQGSGYTLPSAGPGNPGGSVTGKNAPSADNNCGAQKYDLKSGPADLLLVLDRSGSMRDPVVVPGSTNASSKWGEVVAALGPVIMRTQAKVSWGLKLFPAGTVACALTPGVDAMVSPNGYTPVMDAINQTQNGPSGNGTPTRAAVEAATAFMMGSPSPNAKYLVVATDGQPNCVGGNPGVEDRQGAVAAITAAAAAGIPSFVVGIATGRSAEATLNQMAVAGMRPRNDPTTKYYPVANRDELATTLDSITNQIANCTFGLASAPPDPNNVTVEINGTRLGRDPGQANGWNYGPNNRSIVFYGSACETVKMGGAQNVQFLYGCARIME